MFQLPSALIVLLATASGVAADPMPPGAAAPQQDGWREIPAEFDGQFFFLSFRVNEEGPFYFLVDTGTTVTTIDDKAARKAGCRTTKPPKPISGLDVRFTRDARFHNAEVRFEPQEIAVIPLGDRFSSVVGRHVHGLIGADFFVDRAVELDYGTGRMRVREEGDLRPGPEHDVIPLVLDPRPRVPALLPRACSCWWTRAPRAPSISRRAARANSVSRGKDGRL